eukprot:tig00000319_g24127.t1
MADADAPKVAEPIADDVSMDEVDDGEPAADSMKESKPPLSWENVDKSKAVELAPGLTKFVLKESDIDEAKPEAYAKCFVRFDAYREDGTHFDSNEDGKPYEFKLSKGRVIKGWEEGIATMRAGEKARFVCSPEFGAQVKEYPIRNWRRTSGDIPETETTTYDVELTGFENAEPGWEKESWEMDVAEKLEAGVKRKERGNDFYKRADYATAAKKYDACLELFSYLPSSATDEQKAKIREIKVSACLNLAQARLKLGEAKEAETACGKALEEDKENVKALFRRAQALLMLGEFGRAKEECGRAIKLQPGNAELRAEHGRIVAAEKEYREKEKALYAKMMTRKGDPAPKPASDATASTTPAQAAAGAAA